MIRNNSEFRRELEKVNDGYDGYGQGIPFRLRWPREHLYLHLPLQTS
ncbi:MAG: hypothetical protein AB1410_07940 [Acidobacteriota bacterium]